MSMITVYELGTLQHERLTAFMHFANKHLQFAKIKLENIYFDMGQDWKYTALVTYRTDNMSSWQSLCPRDYEKVVMCDSFEQIQAWACKYADEINNSNICVDL